MGAGAFIEPLVVISLLFGGTWINRNSAYGVFPQHRSRREHTPHERSDSLGSVESGLSSPGDEDSLLGDSYLGASSPSLLVAQEPKWRKREIRLSGFRKVVNTPNTKIFQDRLLSRLLQRFPFLVEAWYWALIYWVSPLTPSAGTTLGRAFTAVTLVKGTVEVARQHALQLIHLEQSLHLFHELPIQRFFLAHPTLLTWINRIYSYIHIPGTILFLVWLYYYTTTRNRLISSRPGTLTAEVDGSPAGPRLYEARRRTMAVCNLLAFVVFTAWPCMPPRLLSDKSAEGPSAEEGRSYGFVDTVHGAGGEGSVWTQNRFCNQYAAMPSLHFGYSLLIGLTIMSIPLPPQRRRSRTLVFGRARVRLPSLKRVLLVAVGVAYPLMILVAILATANHFILDAVAGAAVCGVAWVSNRVLLNLLPLEDWFLWCVRIHKPVPRAVDVLEGEDEDGEWVPGKGVVV
ncbi:hypothetical protein H2201_007736 [Coniosporium apollinis]|uniref:Inositolphosphotransferase Aur1/Ipt1 domain-containing protein n=1 Tax=Coniosporium apollinis TaxID=61459 RepID=A0ABQ9NHZ5_9PEZI|nr:hypothetical protein H2201_007736 [Coniosporium apollinis]